MRIDREVALSWVIVAVVAAPVAVWAFNEGVVDFQYDSAGLADPYLGHPAPWFTVAIALVLTAIVALLAQVVRFLARRASGRRWEPAEQRSATGPHPRWWLPLAAGWVAYALGGAAVGVGGGPRTYAATMRFAFGAPIGASVDVPATCTTPVGKPELLAAVAPNTKGLFRLSLLNPATGDRKPYGAFVELVGSPGAATAYPLPNLPARPLPYLRMTMGDGTTRSEPPIGILGAYDYRVTRTDDHEMTGTADVVGTRFTDPYGSGTGPGSLRWIDLEMPNDPWPQTITVTASWECRP